jgi:hypothetical protein
MNGFSADPASVRPRHIDRAVTLHRVEFGIPDIGDDPPPAIVDASAAGAPADRVGDSRATALDLPPPQRVDVVCWTATPASSRSAGEGRVERQGAAAAGPARRALVKSRRR